MRFAGRVLVAVLTTVLASYALDCVGMTTPERRAVLQFDAMPLAQSSGPGLLQEHAIGSPCPRPAIFCAGHVILTDRARNSAGISPVRNLCPILPGDCGGRSRSSVLRLTSASAFTHLVSPPVGFPG